MTTTATVTPAAHDRRSGTGNVRRLPTAPEPDPRVPHDPEAEESALSCALHNPRALAHLVETLDPGDFYSGTNRQVFEVMAGMYRQGEHVDLVTLKGTLEDLGLLGDIPAPYLVTLLEAAPAVAAWETYTVRLTALGRYRRMMDEATKLTAAVRDTSGPARDAHAAAITNRLQELLNPPSVAEYTGNGLLDELNSLVDLSTGEVLAHWGLSDLDAITRGFIPGRMILLAARPGVGKSSLAIQAAANVARRAPVMLWSYEMSAGEVAAHVVAASTRTPMSDILYGRAMSNPRAVKGFEELRQLPLTVRTDAPDIDSLVAATTSAHARQPLGLVVVDYVQLIPVAASSRAGNREQEVAEVSKALKQLAARLKVPVLACAQPNRNAEGRMPVLSDLRESGSLEMDADQVVMLHRPEQPEGLVQGMVAKNRMGRVAGFELAWHPESTSFGSLA